MHTQYLIDAGLTAEQSHIYELLLQYSPIQAGRLALLAQIKRPLVYKILEQLIELDLAEKVENAKIARFSAKHPTKIKEMIDRKIQNLGSVSNSIENVMGDMISKFNLISGKPNVQFFEGEKGMWKILDDTLHVPEGEIVYQMLDLSILTADILRIQNEYAQKRTKRQVMKKIIVPSTPNNITLAKDAVDDLTEIRLFSNEQTAPFTTTVYAYAGKVSYVTAQKGTYVGVIITSQSIFDATVSMFKDIWKNSPPLL